MKLHVEVMNYNVGMQRLTLLPGHRSIHWVVNQLFLCCSMASLSPALVDTWYEFQQNCP